MLKTLKKVDPMSAAKVAGVSGAIFGLVLAIAVTFVGLSIDQYMGRFYTMFGTMMPMIGYVTLVALPVAYGLTGVIFGYVGSLIYNFVAKQMGGIKIDLK